MTRSQPQLATAYAPGAMFTWEGGKGACIAVPVDGPAIDFSARPTRRDQIIESLEEFCQNWLARGMAINRNAPIYESPAARRLLLQPMRQGTRRLISRSTDSSSCVRNGWATCRGRWSIGATPARS